MHRFLFVCISFLITAAAPVFAFAAEDKMPTCAAMDRPCLMRQIEILTPKIDQQDWRDQTFRELAKTYAYEGNLDKAVGLIDKIKTPDTKAMTIRGIGMAAAASKWPASKYDTLWNKLIEQARLIDHGPSQEIAYTYIALSQAFAGNDAAARRTAGLLNNMAQRNKALGETAKIEADRGDLKNAMTSLEAINSLPYKNKAYDTISRIFLDKAMIEEAYVCANKIDNAYLRAKSIQRILNKGNAEEADMEPPADLSKGME